MVNDYIDERLESLRYLNEVTEGAYYEDIKIFEALKLAEEALRLGLEAKEEIATVYHESMHGYKAEKHAQHDAEVECIKKALAAIDALGKE